MFTIKVFEYKIITFGNPFCAYRLEQPFCQVDLIISQKLGIISKASTRQNFEIGPRNYRFDQKLKKKSDKDSRLMGTKQKFWEKWMINRATIRNRSEWRAGQEGLNLP